MIRTRDLVLYVVILLFVLTGITFTLKAESGGASYSLTKNSSPQFTNEVIPSEAGDSADFDREAHIASLKEKLALNTGLSAGLEPVFTSVDTVADTNQDVPTPIEEEQLEAARTELYCPTQTNFSAQITAWPTNAVVQTNEGVRTVSGFVSTKQTVGSSTQVVTIEKTLLQTALQPFRGIKLHCLDSVVVGYAGDGSLLRNDETWKFRASTETNLVGYARDGFPIYGQGVDETLLDSCGGYDNGVSYGYYLRANERFILGCFAAEPQPLL